MQTAAAYRLHTAHAWAVYPGYPPPIPCSCLETVRTSLLAIASVSGFHLLSLDCKASIVAGINVGPCDMML